MKPERFSLSDRAAQAQKIQEISKDAGFNVPESVDFLRMFVQQSKRLTQKQPVQRENFLAKMTGDLGEDIRADGPLQKRPEWLLPLSLDCKTKDDITAAIIPHKLIDRAQKHAKNIARIVEGDMDKLNEEQKRFLRLLSKVIIYNGKAKKWTKPERDHTRHNQEALIKALDKAKQKLEAATPSEKEIQGFETFEKLYKHADKDTQLFLTTTVDGAQIQALLLDLKPATYMYMPLSERESLVKLLKEHGGEDLIVKEECPHRNWFTICSRSGIKRLIDQHLDLFSGHTPESLIDSHYSVEQEHRDEPQWITTDGLLCGYPSSETRQHGKFYKELLLITGLFSQGKMKVKDSSIDFSKIDYSASEKNLLDQFIENAFSVKPHSTLEEAIDNKRKRSEAFLKFVDENKQALLDIINKYLHKYLSNISGVKEYSIQLTTTQLKGFEYKAANRDSDENKEFIKRVNDTFERSGMNDFIRRVLKEEGISS